MSRFLRASILLLLLASCGGGNYSAPRNLDNACALASERPAYFRAMKDTERRWGVPIHVQMATFHQESKFIGNARTPHRYALGIIPMGRQSSAYGYSQALDGTWEADSLGAGNPRHRGCSPKATHILTTPVPPALAAQHATAPTAWD